VIESGISKLPGMAEADDAAVAPMEQGWSLMLGALGRALAGDAQPAGDAVEHSADVAAPPAQVHDALVHPERWWCERIEGAIEPGTQPVLDYGTFGRIRFDVVAVESPRTLTFRWPQGVDDRTVDPRAAPATTVELTVEPAPAGSRVHVRETGFTALPGSLETHVRRAHQAWSVILGLLQHRVGGM